MPDDYTHLRVEDVDRNDAKPSDRWELSPTLGISAYNFNIAHLNPNQRLSQTAYHTHENQTEFFYCISGTCRVETPDDSFDLVTDECVLFEPGTPHLLHTLDEMTCKLVAVGHPPDGRRPVKMIKSHAEILEERYANNTPGHQET